MSVQPEKTHIVRELKCGKPLVSCRFDPTGRFVFAGAEDDTVVRWDLKSDPAKVKPVVFAAHDGWVFALAVSKDGKILLTGGTDGKLTWWHADDGARAPKPMRTVAAHHGWVRSVAIHPDPGSPGPIATCGNDRKVRLWSLADGKPALELPGHSKPVYRVLFTPDGKHLISADLMGLVIQWDVGTGKEARRLDASKLHLYEGGQGVDYGGVRDLSLSRDGSYLACSGLTSASNPLGAVSNPAVLVLDWKTGAMKKLQHPKEDVKGVAWGVRFHPDGFLVAASGGTSGGFLWFSRPDQETEFFKLALPNTARDLDLSPDGTQLATAHHDGAVRISAMKPSA
jgi:WD40 repeat protein